MKYQSFKFTPYYILSYLIVILLAIIISSSGCHKPHIERTIIKTDTVISNAVITPKILIVPGDNILDTIYNPCDSGTIINNYKKHTSASVIFKTVYIKGKKDFIVNCTCDEYKKIIDSFKIVISNKEKSSILETKTITKSYIPKFMWYITGIALLIIIIALSKFLNLIPKM